MTDGGIKHSLSYDNDMCFVHCFRSKWLWRRTPTTRSWSNWRRTSPRSSNSLRTSSQPNWIKVTTMKPLNRPQVPPQPPPPRPPLPRLLRRLRGSASWTIWPRWSIGKWGSNVRRCGIRMGCIMRRPSMRSPPMGRCKSRLGTMDSKESLLWDC